MSAAAGPGALLLRGDRELQAVLEGARVIAVVGIKDDPAEEAYRIPHYLAAHGYRVLGVNPRLAGRELFGNRVVASLLAIETAVDVVDVFRAPAHVLAHAEEALGMEPRPKTFWMQLGISEPAAAERLARGGIAVVQDRCILVDHRRLVTRS